MLFLSFTDSLIACWPQINLFFFLLDSLWRVHSHVREPVSAVSMETSWGMTSFILTSVSTIYIFKNDLNVSFYLLFPGGYLPSLFRVLPGGLVSSGSIWDLCLSVLKSHLRHRPYVEMGPDRRYIHLCGVCLFVLGPLGQRFIGSKGGGVSCQNNIFKGKGNTTCDMWCIIL